MCIAAITDLNVKSILGKEERTEPCTMEFAFQLGATADPLQFHAKGNARGIRIQRSAQDDPDDDRRYNDLKKRRGR
jgi:hypothetical protein